MAQLIVALDVPSAQDAERLVDALYELDVILKIGLEALCAYPERIFSYCEARDVRTFVDAKLHDIPRTVAAAVTALVRPTVQMLNVHALGGMEMMRAAVDAASERAAELEIPVPHIFAVTLLTSGKTTSHRASPARRSWSIRQLRSNRMASLRTYRVPGPRRPRRS